MNAAVITPGNFERRVAKIADTMLGYEDHGIFTAWLGLDYGGSGQGAGGFALDEPDDARGVGSKRHGTAYGHEFIIRLMRAVGASKWEDVKGRTVYALVEPGWNGRVIGIENLPTERGERFLFEDLKGWGK